GDGQAYRRGARRLRRRGVDARRRQHLLVRAAVCGAVASAAADRGGVDAPALSSTLFAAHDLERWLVVSANLAMYFLFDSIFIWLVTAATVNGAAITHMPNLSPRAR